MKKVTAFVASARKKHTYNAAAQFRSNLQSMGDVEVEIVRLSDYRIETCRGCKVCCDKGEELCPLKDDRDILIEKMLASDGVVRGRRRERARAGGLYGLERVGFRVGTRRRSGGNVLGDWGRGLQGGDDADRRGAEGGDRTGVVGECGSGDVGFCSGVDGGPLYVVSCVGYLAYPLELLASNVRGWSK